MSGEWQHGLFGCFSHCGVCIYTWFCPCIIAGKIAEKVGDNCCCCCLVLFVPIAGLICRGMIRQKVREQKNIDGSLCMDILTSWCCGPCALCQEAKEVNALDMAQSMAREEDIDRQ